MTTDLDTAGPVGIREWAHSNCVVCGRSNEQGFGLDFKLRADGSVETTFNCDRNYEGYSNVLHGGVVSCLIDGAMTNCLFSHDVIALTAEVKIRFLQPVTVGVTASVRAWIDRSRQRLHIVKAELLQGQFVKVTAEGKFIEYSPLQKEYQVNR